MEEKILVFKLANEKYATNIMEVERILPYANATKLPECPSFLAGVIDYEDGVLPILNLKDRFSLESTGDVSKSKIIVVKNQKGKFGVIVDDVSEVLNVNSELQSDIPGNMTTFISKDYMKGLVRTESNIIIILDFSKILTNQESSLIF